MELEAERNRADDGDLPADEEVQVNSAATEEDVVPAARVDKNVLDAGEGRHENARMAMGLPVGRVCRET